MVTKHDLAALDADILVVDDEIASLRLLTKILTQEGYRVRPAERPLLALEAALAQPPSLILLDVKMPEMSGFEVCRRLKQDERTRDIPIIFVSALNQVQDQIEGFEVGGVDFISKPFRELEVLARVKTHLQLRDIQWYLVDLVAERTAELAQANKALRVSEEKYRTLVEQAQDGIVVLQDSRIQFANPAAEELFGYSADELLNTVFTEYIFPDELAKTADMHTRRMRGEPVPSRYESAVLHKDGSRVEVGFSAGVTPYSGEPASLVMIRDITERKRTSEERDRILKLSPDLICVAGMDGHFKYVNPAWEGILGYSQEELLARPFLDFIHPEDHGKNTVEVERLAAGHTTIDFENRYIHKDGSVRHISWVATPLLEEETMYCVGRDVTARKQAEEALRESEEKFKALFESSPDLVALTDLDGTFLDLNRVAPGYGKEQVIGTKVSDFLTPQQKQEYRAAVAETIKTGEPQSYEPVITTPEGLDVHWHNRVSPLKIGDRVDRLVINFTDVTERKRAEEELRKGKERLEEAQRMARIGDWEYDVQAGKITWSDEMYRIFGADPQQYVPSIRSDEEFCHPDDALALRTALEQLFATGEPLDLDYRIVTPQCTVKFCHGRGWLILDDQGIPSFVRGTTEDITQRKLVEQQIQEYQQRLQALVSLLTISEERERRRIARELHDEVGQTLAFARMRLASARKASSDAQREAILDDISQSLRQAIGDTRDLIFDLSSPLMHELGLAAALAEWLEDQVGKKHGLQTEFVHDGQRITPDDDMRAILFRSVRELLTNVIKHAQANRVIVRLEGEGTLVRIVVEDDGVGFDVDASLGAMERGAGFGLFSIQERMADLGGSLEIKAEPGQGCTAILTAPATIV